MEEIKKLGFTIELDKFRLQNNLDSFEIGRIIAEHKERYIVRTKDREYDGEILGNLRFTAQSRKDFPAVGDWVAVSEYDDHKVLIHHIFPRKTTIERKAPGKHGEKQIIATNIDFAFVIISVDRDFNINRIERYLTICHSSKVQPIIVLSKIDLIGSEDLDGILQMIKDRISGVEVLGISNVTGHGLEKLERMIQAEKTYCLLGSSGVGKSTILNKLDHTEAMKTSAISQSTNKGRHTTTHRELRILESGGIIIDNPGMREVGITDKTIGLETTFDKISEFSLQCKFKDCTHNIEVGCAVIEAVQNGQIDRDAFENYLRMDREKKHFESSLIDKRKKDKKFGKLMKQYKKNHMFKRFD